MARKTRYPVNLEPRRIDHKGASPANPALRSPKIPATRPLALQFLGCAAMLACLVVAGWPGAIANGQERDPANSVRPLDLFSDTPTLASDHFRIAAWNLRHMRVEEGADEVLPGVDLAEDEQILTATYAKAIQDLQLDALAIIEHQPRPGEPNRLELLRQRLNRGAEGPWRSDESRIEYAYPEPDDPNVRQFGYLQYGLLWNSQRGVTIDPARNRLLDELRQPRDSAGMLLSKENRVPWLAPVTLRAGDRSLEFDWLLLHLKSGGNDPQPAEVDALEKYLRERLTKTPERHVIVAGDWNIRPDQSGLNRGRTQLRKLSIPDGENELMKILTVTRIPPTLDSWAELDELIEGSLANFFPLERILPYSHLPTEQGGPHTLLDHVAISRSLDPIFYHPLRVTLADGKRQDWLAGVEIARPQMSLKKFEKLTDHLPVVLTWRLPRTTRADESPETSPAPVRP
jgi:endonuclease/exonuclease/phosphatase family metal-dependent hydrolase